MQLHQIRAKAHRIIEQVLSAQPVEDSLVELKSQWPDAKKAARLIAGHANAARGASILWLIGLDEKSHKVTGAPEEELSNWIAQVNSCFSQDVFPSLEWSEAITHEDTEKTVVVLVFDTQRAPYVITKPKDEVPYRRANGTFQAQHSDLLRILSPLQELPSIEILYGCIYYNTKSRSKWDVELGLYIVTNYRLNLPQHKCHLKLTAPAIFSEPLEKEIEFRHFRDDNDRLFKSELVKVRPEQVIFDESGYLMIHSHWHQRFETSGLDIEIIVTLTMQPSGLDTSVVETYTFIPSPHNSSDSNNGQFMWKLKAE